ncbi:MAG TPA: PEP-CTERM sorting domain-containing protein [Bryobacteraceae bacterium]|jgi:hypothetical protein
MNKHVRHAWAATILWSALSTCAAHATTVTVANNSFETPGSCNACYAPSGANWIFSTNAGILANGNLDVASPDGLQTGWMQYQVSQSAPEISETLTGFTIGDSYDVNFDYAMRSTGAQTEPFIVSLGANILGSYTPSTTSWNNTTTSSFVATATSYTLSFTGATPILVNQTEADSNIDLVTVNDLGVLTGVPEPGSLVLLASALLFLGARLAGSRRSRGC